VKTDPPGVLIGAGRRADVYDLGGGRVLRRYREGPREVEREAEVMTHARANGVPVPEVFDVAATTDLILEAVTGPTMLQDLTRRPWKVFHHARTLADLHRLVHRVDALEWMRAPFGPGNRLLHVDLHPQNVILTQRGPRIIDWEGAVKGPPEADVAMCWVLMRTSEVPGPTLQRRVGAAGQALFSRLFLSSCPRMDNSWLAVAAEYRMADPTVTSREQPRLARVARRHRIRTGETG
jgi:aminoglycoside phosphotransferase (APT) family kinase protein